MEAAGGGRPGRAAADLPTVSTWRERVVAAAADWVYLPDDAEQHVTDDLAVVGYPAPWSLPTQVMRVRSSRTAADLVAEVDAVVAGWGRPDVAWWIDAATTPVDLESRLRAGGATLAETVTVLAVDLARPLPDFAVPGDVEAHVANDLPALRTFGRVNGAGWDSPEPPASDLTRWLAELAEGTFRVVATAEGEPCATGGMTLVDGVARLWAGVTVPAFRGRGAYRAVLAERLRVARERGATIGLVKGRVATSAPILRRLGFDVFDDERAWRVAVG